MPTIRCDSLLRRTQELVRQRSRLTTYEVIEADTGIDTMWLKRFMADKIDKPCVIKVETLYTYLTKQPLTLA